MSSISFAHTFLKLGVYEDGNFHIEVTRTTHDGIYEVRALGINNGSPQFDDFFINTFTWEVFKSPLGVEAIELPERPKVRTYTMIEDEEENGVVLKRWRYGGMLSSHFENIALFIQAEEGSLLAMDVFNKEASWRLPIGLHSPFKKIVTDMKCGSELTHVSD